jgi:hypothetical protein
MNPTKLVVIVLVLVGLVFALFVARGAFRDDPQPNANRKAAAKEQKAPSWTTSISGLFSSLQPKLQLSRQTYAGNVPPERIPADQKRAFRTARFHLISGAAKIEYKDITPVQSKDLAELKDQECKLPADFDSEHPDQDLQRCSIVALKGGGILTFSCALNSACQVKIE